MIRTGADNSNFDSIFRVPASIAINYIDFTSSIEVALGEFRQKIER
jgi:hypothetical protein